MHAPAASVPLADFSDVSVGAGASSADRVLALFENEEIRSFDAEMNRARVLRENTKSDPVPVERDLPLAIPDDQRHRPHRGHGRARSNHWTSQYRSNLCPISRKSPAGLKPKRS